MPRCKLLYIIPLLLITVLPKAVVAQLYSRVDSLQGTQFTGGVNVTVRQLGTPTSYNYCGVSPYGMWVGGYRFVFSVPIMAVRSHFVALNPGDTIVIKINGTPYTITNANLSSYAGSCPFAPFSAVASGGNLCGTTGGNNIVQFDVQPGYGIDSFDIYESTAFGAGVCFDFNFLTGCMNSVMNAGNDTACIGQNMHLSVSGIVGNSISYAWSGPGFSSTQQNPTVNNMQAASAGLYYITILADTCTFRDTLNVPLHPSPALPVITHNSPVCVGDSLHLNASCGTSGVSFSWIGHNGFGANSQNTFRTNMSLPDSGDYTCTVFINGCRSSDSVHIIVHPRPSGFIASCNSPVCEGDSLHLFGTGFTGATYYWSGPSGPGFTSTAQNPSKALLAFADSGTYTATVTLNGCSASDTTYAVIKKKPSVPLISANTPLCIGNTLNLTSYSSTGGVSYNWIGPAWSSTAQYPSIGSLTTAQSGIYTCTVMLNGCGASQSLLLSVGSYPAAPVASSNSPLCSGSTLNLTASSSTSGVNYKWIGPGPFNSTQQNPSVANVSTSANGTYIVSADIFGCATYDTISVTVNQSLGAPITNIIVSPGDTVCAGITAYFSNTASSVFNPSYQWKKNGVNIPGAGGSSYNSTTVANNDIISCFVKSNGICQPVDTATSNAIKMFVKTLAIPPVNITLSKIGPSYNFSAHVSSGTGLSYQWKKNGINIPFAISSGYSTTNLTLGDKISVMIHSSIACTVPDSAISNEIMIELGLENVSQCADCSIDLYPNPNKGIFTLVANLPAAYAGNSIEIINLLGQVLYKEEFETSSTTFQKPVQSNLTNGIYILRWKTEYGTSYLKFIVEN